MLYGHATEFGFTASSHGTTRPAAAYGTAITAGAIDTYGSYVEVLSDTAITEDCFGILINCNAVGVSAGIREGTLTIGKDEAGGTSYVDWLTDLIVGGAADYTYSLGGGAWYYFPMYIKAGTALAAKWACSTASESCSVNLRVYGRPKNPGTVRYATKFQNFGASAGNGTSITSGTTSDGSWTQVGSSPSTPLWWWQIGWQNADSTASSQSFHIDLARGDASNKHIMIENALFATASVEFTRCGFYSSVHCDGEVTTADLIYMRAQCNGTPDSALTCAAYGVG